MGEEDGEYYQEASIIMKNIPTSLHKKTDSEPLLLEFYIYNNNMGHEEVAE